MTPEPIDGWVFFNDGQWSARCPTDDEVSVCVAGDCFCFSDDTQYYPGGGIDVPLAVVWKLFELSRVRQP